MTIIIGGMFFSFFYVLDSLPESIGLSEGIDIAGNLGEMEIIDTTFDWKEKYTIWSGLITGLILFLSYFGTDQSQAQRYLGGKTLRPLEWG